MLLHENYLEMSAKWGGEEEGAWKGEEDREGDGGGEGLGLSGKSFLNIDIFKVNLFLKRKENWTGFKITMREKQSFPIIPPQFLPF